MDSRSWGTFLMLYFENPPCYCHGGLHTSLICWAQIYVVFSTNTDLMHILIWAGWTVDPGMLLDHSHWPEPPLFKRLVAALWFCVLWGLYTWLFLHCWVQRIFEMCSLHWFNSQPNFTFECCSHKDPSLGFVHNSQNFLSCQESAADLSQICQPSKKHELKNGEENIHKLAFSWSLFWHRHQFDPAWFLQFYWLTYSISFAWKGSFPLCIFNLKGEVGFGGR